MARSPATQRARVRPEPLEPHWRGQERLQTHPAPAGFERRDLLIALLQDAALGAHRPPAAMRPPADLQNDGALGAQLPLPRLDPERDVAGGALEGEPEQELAGLETLHHAHVFTCKAQSGDPGLPRQRPGPLPQPELPAGAQASQAGGEDPGHGAERGRGGAAGLRPWKAAAGGRAHRLADSGGGIPLGGRDAAPAAEAHGGRRRSRAQGLLAKCHQDALLGNDRGPLLKYCATYTPKFSDAFQKEWLADEASAFSVARRVLFDYKPCEPEMWLYLAAKTFPPCRYSGTMEELRAPWPGMREEARPKIVQLYQESAWRREDMSLLEFARKTNKKGDIAQWVLHKRNNAEPLEDFANNCETEGKKLIAVEMVSVFNDRYFGQWLALRIPFSCSTRLSQRRCQQYQHLGNAWARCPEHWSDEDAATKELELEAMGVAKVKSFLAKLKAERHLVGQYLAGHVVQGDAEGARPSLAEAGFPVPDEGLRLNRQQQLLRDSILGEAERAAKARAVEDIDELGELREAAAKEARPIAGLGPPGTGKTTVVGNCVDQILESGGRVLYALPTAQQAARVRSRRPTADVDTCAAAFWLWKERADEHLDFLAQYDLVVVDEVSQLDAGQFERIIQMWEAADRLPALVFTGDFWQLPGVSDSQATDSPKWRRTFKVDLHEMRRCKDEKLRKKLQLLRTSRPTAEQLKDICRGRKAWTHAGNPALEEIEHTTFATCTRHKAAIINQLCVEAQMQRCESRPWGSLTWTGRPTLPTTRRTASKSGKPRPLRQKIYAGMRLHLTRNVNKSLDFVNGMEATVQSLDPASGCLRVTTATGKDLALFPLTEDMEDGGCITCYPARPGYASTIHKLQGAELAHVTIWLDVKHFKAGGYVALSRVQRDTDYLLGGLLEPAEAPAH